MSFNHIENAFLGQAIEALKTQWVAVYGPLMTGRFDLNHPNVTFMIVSEGPDRGKLTVVSGGLEGRLVIDGNGNHVPDPKIRPVDCYNLVRPDEDIAIAVARVFLGRDMPYSTISTNGNEHYTNDPPH